MDIWATTLRGEYDVKARAPVYWIYIPKSDITLQKCIFWKLRIILWKVRSVLKQKFIHQLTSIYSIRMLGTRNKNISLTQPLLRNWPQSDKAGNYDVTWRVQMLQTRSTWKACGGYRGEDGWESGVTEGCVRKAVIELVLSLRYISQSYGERSGLPLSLHENV